METRRNPVLDGVLYGILLAGVYAMVIVVSTPYLPPWTAIRLSLDANWPLFLALTSIFGVMMGLRKWLRNRKICLTIRGEVIGASSSAFSAFFSLFSLTLVGCCGLLALWVSAVLGTAVVISLVQFSLPLAMSALAGMVGYSSRHDYDLGKVEDPASRFLGIVERDESCPGL